MLFPVARPRPRPALLLALACGLPLALAAQPEGMAVDDGGLAMPTDVGPAAPMPEAPAATAVESSVQVITGDPAASPLDVLLQNAFVAFKNGDLKAARTAIAEAQKLEPKNARAKLLEGRVLQAERKFPEATETILSAIELDPAVPRAQYYLGESLLAQGEVLEARGAFAAMVKAEPKNKDARLLVAMCEARLGNLRDASELALTFDPTDPVHPGANFANAALAQASGRTADATEELDSARTTYGPQIWSRYMKSYLLVFPPKQAAGEPAPPAAEEGASPPADAGAAAPPEE